MNKLTPTYQKLYFGNMTASLKETLNYSGFPLDHHLADTPSSKLSYLKSR